MEVREGGGGDVNKNFSRLGSPLRPFIPRINDCGSGPAPCPARRQRRGRPAGLGRAAGARRAAARGRAARSGAARARSAARGRDGGARGRGGCRLPPALPFLPPFPPHRGAFPAAFPRRAAPLGPAAAGPAGTAAPPVASPALGNIPRPPAPLSLRAAPPFSPRPPAPSPSSLLHPSEKPAAAPPRSCPFPTCRAASQSGCGAGSAPPAAPRPGWEQRAASWEALQRREAAELSTSIAIGGGELSLSIPLRFGRYLSGKRRMVWHSQGKFSVAFQPPAVKIVLKGLSKDPPAAWTFLREDFSWGKKKIIWSQPSPQG